MPASQTTEGYVPWRSTSIKQINRYVVSMAAGQSPRLPQSCSAAGVGRSLGWGQEQDRERVKLVELQASHFIRTLPLVLFTHFSFHFRFHLNEEFCCIFSKISINKDFLSSYYVPNIKVSWGCGEVEKGEATTPAFPQLSTVVKTHRGAM